MTKYKWPLSDSSFTLLDKLKVAKFVLTSDQYTMGENVKELERQLGESASYKSKRNDFDEPYCLLTSSGSTSISLLFETWKQLNTQKFKRTVVIAPVVTWGTSVGIPMMAGFDVRLCDITLDDFCFDYDKLETIIKKETSRGKHIILWPTSLLGWIGNLYKLRAFAEMYGCDLWMDCAENQLGSFNDESILGSCDHTITSMYFSHAIQGIELGALFTKNQYFSEVAKCIRNHGMPRHLDSSSRLKRDIESKNKSIDPRFLFAYLGNNYRPVEICALFALLDLQRKESYIAKRTNLYDLFTSYLCQKKFIVPINRPNVAFSIPIICRDKKTCKEAKEICEMNGTETRPIVGSNLARQPAFQHLGDYQQFKVAEIIHHQAFYVGLYPSLNDDQILGLVGQLNQL